MRCICSHTLFKWEVLSESENAEYLTPTIQIKIEQLGQKFMKIKSNSEQVENSDKDKKLIFQKNR